MNQAVSKFSPPEARNPIVKLCECGCGKPAPIAKITDAKWGHRKGSPVRFISGHHSRRWQNIYTHRGDGTTILALYLGTRRLDCVIDTSDFPVVRNFHWFPHKGKRGHSFYAEAYVRKPDGTKTHVRMHRLLLPIALEVDHKDRNGLNNRRQNLRPATRSENSTNGSKRVGASSRFIGVSWIRNAQKWIAQVSVGGKYYYLGYFSSEEEAARARDAKAKGLHGAFASLNFPEAE